MFKGIRAQLFFGFSVLVIVINLFYSRLTFIFVDFIEDIFAEYVISQTFENGKGERIVELTEDIYTSNTLMILTPQQMAKIEITGTSMHDATLFRTRYEEHVGYAHSFTENDNDNEQVWLVINAESIRPLSTFSPIFDVFLTSVAVSALVLAVLITWFIASKLSAPLRHLTESVSRQQPSEPVDLVEAEREDEIGKLAGAFEHTYGELQHAWKREHDFASDVSHELRTPIALIRNTLALTNNDTIEVEDRQLIEQSTATLQNTVEVLLALARKENLLFDKHAFRPLLERTVLSLHHAHAEQRFDIELNIRPDCYVVGNPNLIHLLCQNLVNNGFYHGGGKGMQVYQSGQSVVFQNTLAEHEPSQNYQGLGHGQYLVRRMASVMGWHIHIEQDDNFYSVRLNPVIPE